MHRRPARAEAVISTDPRRTCKPPTQLRFKPVDHGEIFLLQVCTIPLSHSHCVSTRVTWTRRAASSILESSKPESGMASVAGVDSACPCTRRISTDLQQSCHLQSSMTILGTVSSNHKMYSKTEHGMWRLCQTTPCQLALHSEKSML
jgi:hypothetical protein